VWTNVQNNAVQYVYQLDGSNKKKVLESHCDGWQRWKKEGGEIIPDLPQMTGWLKLKANMVLQVCSDYLIQTDRFGKFKAKIVEVNLKTGVCEFRSDGPPIEEPVVNQLLAATKAACETACPGVPVVVPLRYCDCWFCDNSLPNGACRNCGLQPSPERLVGKCDCGGASTGSTHSAWCATRKP
jgi:hypothetical protein